MSALARAATLAATLLLVMLTTGAGEPGVRPGTERGAELVKTGWWWAGNDTPLDQTVVAPPQPSPPNVPKNALPVAAVGGEPEKFSAVEFALAGAAPGGYVEQAVLVIRENRRPEASTNADTAKILACPVTEGFWADGAAGSWKARPSYDCDLASATGERDAKSGVWTFDLTAIAALWVAEDYQGSTSVALVEGAEPPESFQVAFDGPAADGVGFAFSVGKAPSGSGLGDDLDTWDDGSVGKSGSTSTGSGSGALDGGALDGAALAGGGGSGDAAPLTGTAEVAPVGEPAASPAESPAVAPPGTAETTPVAAPVAPPAWYSGIPPVGYVLAPLALAMAYLLMLALGPDAQPAAGPTQHGVGRALERLRSRGAVLTRRRTT